VNMNVEHNKSSLVNSTKTLYYTLSVSTFQSTQQIVGIYSYDLMYNPFETKINENMFDETYNVEVRETIVSKGF